MADKINKLVGKNKQIPMMEVNKFTNDNTLNLILNKGRVYKK